MIQKKICMLGAYAVGKTSLVQRYVHSIYFDNYLTTVGVKIDKKALTVNDQIMNLILWDIAGGDEVSAVRLSYLRGAAGYLLVVDGTRPETLDIAYTIERCVAAEIGTVPFVVLFNKYDLAGQWQLPGSIQEDCRQAGWSVLNTSAKTGEGVEQAFHRLAGLLLT